MLKKVIYITLTIIILGGSVYLATFAGIEHRNLQYRSFNLQIANPQDQPLVTEEELVDALTSRFGKIEGKNLNSVQIFEIEQFLVSNPYISSANVYATLNGEMSATVITRVPLLRVFNNFDESYLIDTAGTAMPVSSNHPLRLPVATGFIKDHFKYHKEKEMNIQSLEEASIIRDLFKVTRLISKDEFLNALVGQIYVNEFQEMEVMPKIGNQLILFGTADNAQEKLKKLRAFYLQVIKHTGWDTYKTINLTFDNQVVCTK